MTLSRVVSWRRTTSEQALYYRDHRRDFDKYTGEYILLQENEVKWHRREQLSPGEAAVTFLVTVPTKRCG